jgi:hypothetical protein
MLLAPASSFDIARRIREPAGAPIAEVFTFLSGLYFRGKLTYARTFADPPPGAPAMHVITTNRGLVSPELPVRHEDLVDFSGVDIATGDPRYLEPLSRDVAAIVERHPSAELVLLGSIGTGKYVDPLLALVGERLVFPSDFVGRGDMSRGALLLRAAREGRALPCVPLLGAARRGPRATRVDAMARGGE